VPLVVVPAAVPPTVVPQGMPLGSVRVEVEEFNPPEEFNCPVFGEFNWPEPVVNEFNWLPWVLRMPELVGERVEPAAEPPALPGMVLLLAALLPVVPLVTPAPPVVPAAAAPLDPPAGPPAAAPPPAPAASAMLLPPRKATVASKAMQCLMCVISLLLVISREVNAGLRLEVPVVSATSAIGSNDISTGWDNFDLWKLPSAQDYFPPHVLMTTSA
jgi:hypothetical protein